MRRVEDRLEKEEVTEHDEASRHSETHEQVCDAAEEDSKKHGPTSQTLEEGDFATGRRKPARPHRCEWAMSEWATPTGGGAAAVGERG